MAIDGKNKASSFARGARKGQAGTEKGIESTFRTHDEKRETTKTTLDFDKAVYQTLKLHAVKQNTTVRKLVDMYVRAGLEADQVSIEE